MFLKELFIINYMSCRESALSFPINEPLVFIGINDSGKSAALRAIGLFLSEKQKFSFLREDKGTSDLSNTRLGIEEYKKILNDNDIPILPYDESQCIIIGKFKIQQDEINESHIDQMSKHFLWTIEKSVDNSFFMAKVFDETQHNTNTYLLSFDSTESQEELWNKGARELGLKRTEYGVSDADIENENKAGRYKNIEIIRAIYSKTNLNLFWSFYKDFKKDSFLFPEYRYLDWNMTMDDLNNFANDVMNLVIEDYLARTKDFANTQALEAEEQINSKLIEIAKTLAEDIPNISEIKAKFNFNINSQLSNIMINKKNSDGLIQLESQGEGVKRQIWFSLLKWRSMQNLGEGDKAKRFIWCFDEPETHLYPSAQRQFYDIIKRISQSNVQSILSTHSTIFIDRSKLTHIYNFNLDDSYTTLSKCKSVDDIYGTLQVKNSDFLFFDKFLVVEGDTEQYLIPHLYGIFKGSNFLENNIQLINLKGKDKRAQNLMILKSILSEFRKPAKCLVCILDNDINYEVSHSEISGFESIYFLGIQDIEDAIDSSIWLNCVNKCISDLKEDIKIDFDEIEGIKAELKEEKTAMNKKFYPRLQSLLRKKINEKKNEFYSVLPDKGEQLAKLLISNINDLTCIKGDIIKAFQALD